MSGPCILQQFSVISLQYFAFAFEDDIQTPHRQNNQINRSLFQIITKAVLAKKFSLLNSRQDFHDIANDSCMCHQALYYFIDFRPIYDNLCGIGNYTK